MREIPLSQGMVALVDDEDYKYLKLFKWYAKESKISWYAVRMKSERTYSCRGRKKRSPKKRTTLRMHNVIMKPELNQIVHHKEDQEGNIINNQRGNLELVTLAGNNQRAADKAKENRGQESAAPEYVPF